MTKIRVQIKTIKVLFSVSLITYKLFVTLKSLCLKILFSFPSCSFTSGFDGTGSKYLILPYDMNFALKANAFILTLKASVEL